MTIKLFIALLTSLLALGLVGCSEQAKSLTTATSTAKADSVARADSIHKADSVTRVDSILRTDSIAHVDSALRADSVSRADSVLRLDSIVQADSLAIVDSILRVDSIVRADSLAWVDSVAPAGVNLLHNGNFTDSLNSWKVELVAPASATTEVVAEGPNVDNAMKVSITAIDSTDHYGWHVQINQAIPIVAGKNYTLTFWAKSALPAEIAVVCMQNHAPFSHHLAEIYPSLTTDWTQFELQFSLDSTDTNMRINLGNLAKEAGQVYWFADLKLIAD